MAASNATMAISKQIWPAARGLSFYIWDKLDFKGGSLLELGSGLGLPGVVCGLKGARVTFSDFNPRALEISAKNALLNGLGSFSCLAGDWRCFPPAGKFQWVVGSDIFYDPRLNPHLAAVIKEHLAGGGYLLLAHPGRQASFEFIAGLMADGFKVQDEEVRPVCIDDPHFPYYEIRINLLRRPEGLEIKR